jgi:SAM-dependent methyltransferase
VGAAHLEPEEALAGLQRVFDDFARGRPGIRVLEAGCGSRAPAIRFGPNAHRIGLDISRVMLERNEEVDEKILGDVQSYALPQQSVDAIFCWDVLEHVPAPSLALDRFAATVRPHGLVILKVPNLMSVKGLVTRLTPHAFHVWVYRRVFGYTDAGAEGRPPFPTFLRRSIAPAPLLRAARSHGWRIVYMATYEDDKQARARRRIGLDGRLWKAVKIAVRAATLRRVSADRTEVILACSPGGPVRPDA